MWYKLSLVLLVILGLYNSGTDLKFFMNSDGVDEYNINKFLSEVFTDKNLCGKACSIVKEPASRKFDIKEEVTFFYYFATISISSITLVHLADKLKCYYRYGI